MNADAERHGREIPIDELSEYLDAGERPPRPEIDDDPEHQRVLAGLRRLRRLADSVVQAEVGSPEPPPLPEHWYRSVLDGLSREARAGRDVAIDAADGGPHLVVTEGALRGTIRDAADRVDGIVLARCALDGDLDRPGAPIRVHLRVHLVWPTVSLGPREAALRDGVAAAVASQLGRPPAAVDITVADIEVPGGEGGR